MIKRGLPLLFLILLWLHGTAPSQSPGPKKATEPVRGYLPAPPARLARILPKPLPEWKLTAATAKTSYSGWILSSAQRSYQKTTSATAGAAEGSASATIRIQITDTTEQPGQKGWFGNFRVGERGGLKRYMENSTPAILASSADDQGVLQLFVGNRFLLRYTYSGVNEDELRQWIKATTVDQLKSFRKGKVGTLPAKIRLIELDTINPKNNRSYEVAVLGASGLKAEILQLKNEEKESAEYVPDDCD